MKWLVSLVIMVSAVISLSAQKPQTPIDEQTKERTETVEKRSRADATDQVRSGSERRRKAERLADGETRRQVRAQEKRTDAHYFKAHSKCKCNEADLKKDCRKQKPKTDKSESPSDEA